MGITLGILGVTATIIVGILGIRYSKKFTGNVSLTFVEHEWIPLFRTIVKNLDEVEVRFKQKPISENIILLNGSLINDGNYDIDKSIVHKPLSIHLPKEFKFLKAKVTKHSKNVDAHCEIINDNRLNFHWDLLKKEEFISFNSLIEFQKGDNEEDKDGYQDLSDLFQINFEHRITNLSKVKEEKWDLNETEKVPIFIKKLGLPILTILIGIFFCFSGPFGFSQQYYDLSYHLVENNNKRSEIELIAKDEKYIAIVQKGKEEVKVLPEELFGKYRIEPYIKKSKEIFIVVFIIMGGGFLIIILSILVFLIVYKEFRMEKKLRKIFSD
jgi:hypothetical protein